MEETVPLQIPTMDPQSRTIIERYKQVWTPTILLLSPQGDVYHEWSGYLPPDRYLAQVSLGLGKAALKEDRYEEAKAHFDRAVREYPKSDAAPEALYWAAVAAYKGSGQGSDLVGGWAKLREQYPDSEWRIKQSFMES